MKHRPLLERIARRLCRLDGHPETTTFEGKPMWQSYLGTAHTILVELTEPTDAMVRALARDFPSASTHDIEERWRRSIAAAVAEGA